MRATPLRKGTHAAHLYRAGRAAVRNRMDIAALLNSLRAETDRVEFERGMRAERTSQRRKLLAGLPRKTI